MVNGEIFSELLTRDGVNMRELSEQLDVPYHVLADWKRGRTLPKIEVLQRVASHFGVSVEYLAGVKQTADPKINEILLLAAKLSAKQQEALIAFIKTLLLD